MEYVVLGAVILVALVIGVDSLRERARLRRVLHVPPLVAARLQGPPGGPDVYASVTNALARPPSVERETVDVFGAITRIVDPEAFHPKLATGAQVRLFRLKWGNDYAVIASPERTDHLYLQPWEAELVEQMDGTLSTEELIVQHLRENGDLDPGAVLTLVDLLRTEGFLEPRTLNVGEAVTRHMDRSSPGRRKLRQFGKTLSIGWDDADRLVSGLHRLVLRFLWTPAIAIAATALAVAGFLGFWSVYRSDRFVLSPRAAPVETVILLALSFILTFAHELGHATVLSHYDRKVISAGFQIYFGSPAFFVNASDGLMLERKERILQSLAGPFAELILAGIAGIALFFFPSSGFAPLLYRFAILNYFVIFLNLIPLLELDGYWILSDVIQVPDLRPRSLAFIQSELWAKLRRHDGFSLQEAGLGLYGFIGIVFTVISLYTGIYFWREIFGGLIVSLWNGGVGSRLLLILLVLAFTGPVIRGAIAASRALYKRVRAIADRLRFRSERSWRIEAAELIDGLPVFEDLPEELLSDLAGRVRLRTFRPGYAVFRQGDRAAAFYVIRKGTVRVEEEDPEAGDVRVLRTLGRGEAFGELGLIESAARKATVRAEGYVELFEVDKPTFDRLLVDSIHAPRFKPTMQAFADLRALPAFSSLRTDDLAVLLEHGSWAAVAPGEDLIRQGERGDAFFAIQAGQVDVIRDGSLVVTLGPGEHFGEVALLEDAPRNATVRARTPLRAFRLDQTGFDQVVAASLRRSSSDRTSERKMDH